MMKSTIVVLGSTSPIKLEAVRGAFTGELYSFATCDAKSLVPEQPVGKVQTREGATNRCNAAKLYAASLPPRDNNSVISIGIENGMWQAFDGRWVDGACIVMMKNGVYHECWSETIDIPPDHPKGEHGMWSAWKDPHIRLCGKSRAQILKEALVAYIHQ